ncbi:MAG: sigma-54 dependent transcriptional regulator [Albidovulum sp.]|nr:sigma-54 dependent transcriptional regulator [Albidovulum sp.]
MKRDVLIVDDDAAIRQQIAMILEDVGLSTREASGRDECMLHVNTSPPALVILDLWLAGENKREGLDILKELKQNDPDIPVVIISGHGSLEVAVNAMKFGAHDYIEKPFRRNPLLSVTMRALETSRLRSENAALRSRRLEPAEMVGSSAAMTYLRQNLEKVASNNCRVMLTGPAGSGKETAARFVHARSARSDAPFVSVNLAAVDDKSCEEVLFGQEMADGGIVPGLFEAAHRGILYFHEVADLPMDAQSKLLRMLVSERFQRVGGSAYVRIDCKVVSSTCRDLVGEYRHGRFREDLYHRLNVVNIEVPSLAARSGDIPELAEHFIKEFRNSAGLPNRSLTSEARIALSSMSWPGNVRQLKNAIERILILGPESGPISDEEIEAAHSGANDDQKTMLPANLLAMPVREARQIFEREYFISQINRYSGNISETAKHVGMERSALHRKLKGLGITTLKSAGSRVAIAEVEIEDPRTEEPQE